MCWATWPADRRPAGGAGPDLPRRRADPESIPSSSLGQASASGRVHRLPLRRLSEDAVRQLSATSRVDAGPVFAMTSGNPFLWPRCSPPGRATGSCPRSPTRCWPGCAAWMRPPRMRWSSWRWFRPWWSVAGRRPGGGRAGRAGGKRARPADGVTGLGGVPARAAPPGGGGLAWRWRAGWRCTGGCSRPWPGRGRRPVAHRPPRGSGRRRGRDRRRGAGGGRDAVAAGAHRGGRPLSAGARSPGAVRPAELAELLERYAVECYTIGASEAPIVESEAHVGLRRSLGDQRARSGRTYAGCPGWYWAGDRAAAERSAAEAIAVLEAAGDRRLLALALSNQSQLHMLAYRASDCAAVGERAVVWPGEGGRCRDPVLRPAQRRFRSVAARRPRGMVADGGEPAGRAGRRRGRARLPLLCRASAGTSSTTSTSTTPSGLAEGIGLAERHDHLGFLGYLTELGMLKLARAAWDDAVRAARRGLADAPLVRHGALTVLGGGYAGASRAATSCCAKPRSSRSSCGSCSGPGRPPWPGPRRPGWAGDLAAVRAIAGPAHDEARRLGYAPLQAELTG